MMTQKRNNSSNPCPLSPSATESQLTFYEENTRHLDETSVMYPESEHGSVHSGMMKNRSSSFSSRKENIPYNDENDLVCPATEQEIGYSSENKQSSLFEKESRYHFEEEDGLLPTSEQESAHSDWKSPKKKSRRQIGGEDGMLPSSEEDSVHSGRKSPKLLRKRSKSPNLVRKHSSSSLAKESKNASEHDS
eukprot:10995273-Ditylum_brightwellii.AAC.1